MKSYKHRLRWTFGNHEPVSMYRRLGRKSTGAMEGAALWLEKWHGWYDSEKCAKQIAELGFNILHCRFYKGMGWEFEKKDFPGVKSFVENCHKYNIRVLAYVQFSTLYYEIMQSEISDLKNWAAIDHKGHFQTYNEGEYYRWMPCIAKRSFIDYLKSVIKTGLDECPFDGIMFDNAHHFACYCPECQEDFRNYLRNNPLSEELTGLPFFDNVLIPPPSEENEIKDPLRLLYMEYHTDKSAKVFKELYDHIKSISSELIVSGNLGCIRRYSHSRQFGLDCFKLKDCFDIAITQSGNAPTIRNAACINRIREHKLADALGMDVLALSDHDGGLDLGHPDALLLNLAENAVWNGIPVERTIMAPCRKNMVNTSRIAKSEKVFKRFFEFIDKNTNIFEAEDYCPVRILYSRESISRSRTSSREVINFEEILMRSHVPYGLLATSSGSPLEIPEDCELLIIPEQYCLSDSQMELIEKWVGKGGNLILTPKSGYCDEYYREREVYFAERLSAYTNAHVCPASNQANISMDDWTINPGVPCDMESIRRLVKSLIKMPFDIEAPESLFVNVKLSRDKLFMHFLNYDISTASEVIVRIPHETGAELSFPFENRSADFRADEEISFTMKTPCSFLSIDKK